MAQSRFGESERQGRSEGGVETEGVVVAASDARTELEDVARRGTRENVGEQPRALQFTPSPSPLTVGTFVDETLLGMTEESSRTSRKEGENEDSLIERKLPQEILSHIFALLEFAPSLALVNRRWASIYDSSVRLDMSEEDVDRMFWSKRFSEVFWFFNALERRYRVRPRGVIPMDGLASLMLTKSAEFGRASLVALLLEDGRADPGARDDWAIRWASRNGHSDVVKLLLKDKRCDPAAKSNYAVRWACENGHVDIVKLLLADDRVNPSDQNNSALLWASLNCHIEVVSLLLSCPRVDPSSKIHEALRMAKQNAKQDKRVEINNRCIEVVKLLISYLLKKQNMDISMKYKHFTWACSNGIASIVKQFLDDQAVDPTVNDNEALRNACTNGITEVH
eukprot:TRINITY_DN5474_c0_g1_i1.p1 TRINITY_DN5474_c0_g1~~TRINITY_DN5474_c0_g1_i1.p1  ORF type:complete len:395 (+),score=57.12 TRINITY_DN5474_c0_g1_i1:114-1298(+)